MVKSSFPFCYILLHFHHIVSNSGFLLRFSEIVAKRSSSKPLIFRYMQKWIKCSASSGLKCVSYARRFFLCFSLLLPVFRLAALALFSLHFLLVGEQVFIVLSNACGHAWTSKNSISNNAIFLWLYAGNRLTLRIIS